MVDYVWVDWEDLGERDVRRVLDVAAGRRPVVLLEFDVVSILERLEAVVADLGTGEGTAIDLREAIDGRREALDTDLDRLRSVLEERHLEHEVVRWTVRVREGAVPDPGAVGLDPEGPAAEGEASVPDRTRPRIRAALLVTAGVFAVAQTVSTTLHPLRIAHRWTGSATPVRVAGALDPTNGLPDALVSGLQRDYGGLARTVADLERRTGHEAVVVTDTTGAVDVLSVDGSGAVEGSR